MNAATLLEAKKVAVTVTNVPVIMQAATLLGAKSVAVVVSARPSRPKV